MFYVGVDLGQTRDHTAIAVVERPLDMIRALSKERHVRSVRRVPLGTPYPQVVDLIRRTVQHPKLWRQCRLAVDATGIGAPVVDMMRGAAANGQWGCDVSAVVITAGERASKQGNRWSVPKRDLLAGVQMLLERGEMRIAKEMKNLGTLMTELQDMERWESGSGKVRMGAEGAGQHDDLVIALALACWRAGWKDIGGHEGPLF